MKKVLFGIFTVLLSINSGCCDELNFVSQSDSIPSIYNNTINIQAITNSFDVYNTGSKCYISGERRDKFITNIYANFQNGINPTVETVYNACLMSDDGLEIFKLLDTCTDCIKAIVEQHNLLLLNNPFVFKSKDDYNQALQAKGFCTPETVKDAPSSTVYKHQCKNECKKMAIKNACVLKGYAYGLMNQIACDCFFESTILDFVPTWEDYKKLYNIK